MLYTSATHNQACTRDGMVDVHAALPCERRRFAIRLAGEATFLGELSDLRLAIRLRLGLDGDEEDEVSACDDAVLFRTRGEFTSPVAIISLSLSKE